jgi:5-methylcytosine-specific restriction protein A
MRTEFSRQTKRGAYERSEGLCEGLRPDGERCCANLKHKIHHFDHIIPDAIGGDNSLQNCQVLCVPCHDDKTRKIDMRIIAKAKRNYDKHRGIIKKPSTFACSRNSRFKKKIDGTVVERQ